MDHIIEGYIKNIDEQIEKMQEKHDRSISALTRIKEICQEELDELKQKELDELKQKEFYENDDIKFWLNQRTEDELRIIVSDERIRRMYYKVYA